MENVIDFEEYKNLEGEAQWCFDNIADLLERGELSEEEIKLFFEQLD